MRRTLAALSLLVLLAGCAPSIPLHEIDGEIVRIRRFSARSWPAVGVDLREWEDERDHLCELLVKWRSQTDSANATYVPGH